MQIAGFTLKRARPPRAKGQPVAPGGGRKKKPEELKRLAARAEEYRIRTRAALAKRRYLAVRDGEKSPLVADGNPLTVDGIAKVRKQLRAIGLDVVHGDGSPLQEGSGVKGFLKDLFSGDDGKQLFKMGLEVLAGAQAAQAQNKNGNGARPQPAPQQQRALPPPGQPAAPGPAEPVYAPGPDHPQANQPAAAPEESAVAHNVHTAISLMEALEPDEAARQIIALAPLLGASDMVTALTQWADEQREELYDQLIASENTTGKPAGATVLVTWLRARPEWTQQTIDAMRVRKGIGVPVATVAGESKGMGY